MGVMQSRCWQVPMPVPAVARPTYLVDGRCGFCMTWMARVQRLFPGTFDAVSLYEFDLPSVGLDLADAEREGHFLVPTGDRLLIRSGSQSWAGILLEQRAPARWIGVLMEHQPVRALADVVYSMVARNRHRLPGGTPLCMGPTDSLSG
jgi:predicted DCC family thiol-disulfide oxidoreductase YuxK